MVIKKRKWKHDGMIKLIMSMASMADKKTSSTYFPISTMKTQHTVDGRNPAPP